MGGIISVYKVELFWFSRKVFRQITKGEKMNSGRFILFIGIILLITGGAVKMFTQSFSTEINTNWKFHQADKVEWHPAEVPGASILIYLKIT